MLESTRNFDPQSVLTQADYERGFTFANSVAVYVGGDPDSPTSYKRVLKEQAPNVEEQ